MLAIFVGVRAEHNAADWHIEILERRQRNNRYVISPGTFGDKPVQRPLPSHTPGQR